MEAPTAPLIHAMSTMLQIPDSPNGNGQNQPNGSSLTMHSNANVQNQPDGSSLTTQAEGNAQNQPDGKSQTFQLDGNGQIDQMDGKSLTSSAMNQINQKSD